jgi:CheY-like chemotaxis protein
MGIAGDFLLIALTADVMPELQGNALGDASATEFDLWLTKPIDWPEMSEAIERVIRQTEKVSPVAAP